MSRRGRAGFVGIFLSHKLSQINEWRKDHRWKPDEAQTETYVVQRYIENPLLVGGKKFDLRIYALVTSFNPLVCYLYCSGFARFTGFRYSSSAKKLGESYMHLTNVAIQKTVRSGRFRDKGDKPHHPAQHIRRPATTLMRDASGRCASSSCT